MNFIKMQSVGNDYICIDCFHNNISIEEVFPHIPRLCDRHFGIGGDGVIFILPSNKADAEVKMYNKDGSETKVNGSALVITAKYLYESRLVLDKNIILETKTGIRCLKLEVKENKIENIELTMGRPNWNAKQVPVITENSFFINNDLLSNLKATCLSLGNPHTVIYNENINRLNIENLGPNIETHYLFPERTNVEFVQKRNDTEILTRMWSRGSGETLSCGSGACASVAAGVMLNLLEKEKDIKVISPGGSVLVNYKEDDELVLKSTAEKVYQGKVYLKNNI